MSERRHLLVVDHDPDVRELLDLDLTAQGYRVSTAAGGREALQALEEDGHELLILDLLVPDMDGLRLLHELREARGSDLPVLVLATPWTRGEGSEQDLLAAGASAVAFKPVDRAHLLGLIRHHLRGG